MGWGREDRSPDLRFSSHLPTDEDRSAVVHLGALRVWRKDPGWFPVPPSETGRWQGRSQLRGSGGVSPPSRASWRLPWWVALPHSGSSLYGMEDTSMPSTFINGMGWKVKGKSGDPGKTRTSDTQFRKLLLYPPELRGQLIINNLRDNGDCFPRFASPMFNCSFSGQERRRELKLA